MLSPTQHDHAREVSLLDRLMHGATDGVLIILPEESTEELVRLQSGSCPFVVVDPLLRLDPRVPCVSAAHRSGADQAMQHLLALGHQRIAAITGPPGWVATEDRRSGYRAALSGAGIERDPVLEVDADFELGPGAVAAGRLLELPEPPTAIFAFNDSIALGAMRAGTRAGGAFARGSSRSSGSTTSSTRRSWHPRSQPSASLSPRWDGRRSACFSGSSDRAVPARYKSSCRHGSWSASRPGRGARPWKGRSSRTRPSSGAAWPRVRPGRRYER